MSAASTVHDLALAITKKKKDKQQLTDENKNVGRVAFDSVIPYHFLAVKRLPTI